MACPVMIAVKAPTPRNRILLARILVAVVAAVVAFGVVDGTAAETKRMPVSEAGLKQKALFINNLITRSAAAKLIQSKGSESDRAAFDRARQLLDQAQDDLKSKRLEQAEANLNTALKLVTETARGLNDGEDRHQRQVRSFESRRDSVSALLNAYDRVAAEKGTRVTPDSRKRRAEAGQLLAQANKHFKSGNFDDARAELGRTYVLASQITQELRQGDTLVRELNFETAEDEYHYEIDRNDSHLFLLEVTVKEKNPRPQMLATIEQLKQEATTLRRRAEQEAKSGNFEAGIATLGESTKKLIRAIRAGGNFIPG